MILHPAKVATPAAAVFGLVVQAKAPPPAGWVAMAKVTLAVLLVLITLPPLSSTLTAGWVVQVAPLAPPLGWVLKASWVAGPTVRLNELVVAVLSPVALALRV